jgi:transposase
MEVLMDKYIGIDVAKATLQIYIPKGDSDIEIKNSPDGLKKFYSKLKKQYKKELNDIVFVYESTGAYSTILEQFCQDKEILCFKVGAYQSASFSKVIKNRSKTDKIDARMLSQMHILAKEKDIKVPKRDAKAHQIRSYIKYYQSLVKEHRRLSNYLEPKLCNRNSNNLKSVPKKS